MPSVFDNPKYACHRCWQALLRQDDRGLLSYYNSAKDKFVVYDKRLIIENAKILRGGNYTAAALSFYDSLIFLILARQIRTIENGNDEIKAVPPCKNVRKIIKYWKRLLIQNDDSSIDENENHSQHIQKSAEKPVARGNMKKVMKRWRRLVVDKKNAFPNQNHRNNRAIEKSADVQTEPTRSQTESTDNGSNWDNVNAAAEDSSSAELLNFSQNVENGDQKEKQVDAMDSDDGDNTLEQNK